MAYLGDNRFALFQLLLCLKAQEYHMGPQTNRRQNPKVLESLQFPASNNERGVAVYPTASPTTPPSEELDDFFFWKGCLLSQVTIT